MRNAECGMRNLGIEELRNSTLGTLAHPGPDPGPDRDHRLSRLIQACRARAGLVYSDNRLIRHVAPGRALGTLVHFR